MEKELQERLDAIDTKLDEILLILEGEEDEEELDA